MADPRRRVKVGPVFPRIASGKLIIPDEVASRIENMFSTEEGTLRSVWGPAPYVPSTVDGSAPPSSDTPAVTGLLTYGNHMKGIFHCRLDEGEREILLLHTRNQIWTFVGWQHRSAANAWLKLIGPASAPAPVYEAALPDDNRPRFPTQFVATPTGVVIIPQDSIAYFYDGQTALPLGYNMRPSPPEGLGPRSENYKENLVAAGYVNNESYAHDALHGMNTQMHAVFKFGRIGTTLQSGNGTTWGGGNPDVISGWLEPGSWRAAVQFIDLWGNLSPLSGESGEVRFERQAAQYWEIGPLTGPTMVDRVRKEIAWTSIPTGPKGTIGRILYRSKDRINSGTVDLFEVPLNATESSDAFATLPDNCTTIYPDNIPDFWLTRKPLRPVPVEEFKIACMAFGRLWAANFAGQPGMIRPSMIGRWGTFLENEELFPDPSGSEVTGILAVPSGVLALTEMSAYIIVPSDDGLRFRSMSLSQTVGCLAPSSLKNLPDGRAIWLGREGFFTFDGTKIDYISEDLEEDRKRFNYARLLQACSTVDVRSGTYRCWLPIDGGRQNTLCAEYDGVGWKLRSDVDAGDVCTTRDHLGYMLAAGRHNGVHGVWLLDHEVQSYISTQANTRQARVRTAWLSATASDVRRTTYQVRLWLREYGSGSITVDVQRDWRDDIIETHSVPIYPTDDAPPFWGTAAYNASTTTWRRRRPYWRRLQIFVPSAEVFRLDIRGTGRWEFIGLQFEEVQHNVGGARTPP